MEPADEQQEAKCLHPQLRPDFYLGSRTGDMVCTTCNEEFSPADLKAMGR